MSLKKQLINIAKEHGVTASIKINRYEFSAVSYDAELHKNGVSKSWDGGYFIGEKNSPNSKESMIENWTEFVSKKFQ